MTGFDLSATYHDNLESLFRKVRKKTIHRQGPVPFEFGSTSTAPPCFTMAEKTIREFSVPSCNNIPTGPEVQTGENFELKPGVIHMVQAIPFCELASEDANNHLQ